jgi:hypothetical protein
MVQVRLRLLGSGKILAAQVVPRPDKIGMMQKMAKMDMKMGAHALNIVRKKMNASKLRKSMVQMDMSKDPAMKGMDMNHSKMEGWKRTTSSQMDMSKDLQRKEWKWIILRWKG